MKKIQTGIEARMIEQLYGLYREIMYFEHERLNSNDLDPLRTNILYDMYWDLFDELVERGLI